jgi:hypothetical protein
MSKGYINGSGSATFNFSINQNTGKWSLRMNLNKSIPQQTGENETMYVYSILVPKTIGCDINLEGALGTGNVNDVTHKTVLVQRSGGSWDLLDEEDSTLSLNFYREVGCFVEYHLRFNVDYEQTDICDVIICSENNEFTTPGCYKIEGCEKFQVIVSELASENIADAHLTTIADEQPEFQTTDDLINTTLI